MARRKKAAFALLAHACEKESRSEQSYLALAPNKNLLYQINKMDHEKTLIHVCLNISYCYIWLLVTFCFHFYLDTKHTKIDITCMFSIGTFVVTLHV